MAEKENTIVNTCDFRGIKPVMMDLPYPEIKVQERNRAYANLLSIDYCGSVSELSAITQYINNENRLSCEKCPIAKTLLGIAVAEMMHLQKLGELIFLLGGKVEFSAKYWSKGSRMWTPRYLNIPENPRKMILADIEAEKDAIKQYRVHIKMIKDCFVNDVLERIIRDEEYHIMVLQELTKEI